MSSLKKHLAKNHFLSFWILLSITCWGWGAGELFVLVASAQDDYQEQNT
ncbi:MAG: hypothetical protein P1P73_02150 [Brevefilum sp.]|nr:hypothetical protein [Brevefilum sp.]